MDKTKQTPKEMKEAAERWGVDYFTWLKMSRNERKNLKRKLNKSKPKDSK